MQARKQSGLALIQDFIHAALLSFLRQAFQLAFDCDQIVEQKFAHHHFDIARRIHTS